MDALEKIAEALRDLPPGSIRRASFPSQKGKALPSGIHELDELLSGGWPCGRSSVLRGGRSLSSGRTTVAAASVASVTAGGRPAAWVDGDGSLDPDSLSRSGAVLERVLWVRGPMEFGPAARCAREVLDTEGFALVVLSVPPSSRDVTAARIRLSRTTERSKAALLVIERSGEAVPFPGAFVLEIKCTGARWTGSLPVLSGLAYRAFTADGREATFIVPTPEAAMFGNVPHALPGTKHVSNIREVPDAR